MKRPLRKRMEIDSKISILFVDDEPEVVQPLALESQDQGYNTYIAKSGKEGLEILRETTNPSL